MPSHYTSSLSTGPSVFDQSTTFAPAYPDLIHDSKHPSWQLDPVPAQDQRTRKTKKKHHSRKHKKHRSKKHKFAAYIVQLIGVLCLILAALKSFEPLAGIGFTLVVIGYDSKKLKKKGWVDDIVKWIAKGRAGEDGKREKRDTRQKALVDREDGADEE